MGEFRSGGLNKGTFFVDDDKIGRTWTQREG